MAQAIFASEVAMLAGEAETAGERLVRTTNTRRRGRRRLGITGA
jgi:hypothetical protein